MAKKNSATDASARQERKKKARKRYFENKSGRFLQVQLMSTLLSTWEGEVGEDVGAKMDMCPNIFVAEEKYDKLVQKHLAGGYREMPKPKRTKKPRPKKKRIPKQWNDEIFGELNRVQGTDGLWEKNIKLKFLGKIRDLKLTIDAEYEEGFSRQQKQAFTRFMEGSSNLLRTAEQELLTYYKSICSDLRDQFGDSKDDWAPIVRSKKQFSEIVTLTALYIPSEKGRSRTLGLLLNCTWDDSHGIAVKFVNEKLKEIDNQDIIL